MSAYDAVEDLEGDMHYRVLGLRKGAPAAEIKRAYRARARELHPDKGGDPLAFAKVQVAYEILSDPAKREVYDSWAHRLR